MKKTDYDLPIFEDKDIGDLNYYSEEMAKAIKIQIDKFGNPLIFKGTVETLEELQKLTNVKNGEIYRVKIEKKNYIYDGENWTIYSDNTDSDFDELKAKTIKCLQEVETPTPVSGESIDISDSAEAKIGELKISGNSKQETSTQSRNICFTDFSEWESGEYNGQGNKTDISSRLRLKELLKVETSTTYYFNTFLTNYKIIVRTCDENKTVVRSIGPVDNGGTITTSETECYLMVTLYNSVSADGVTYDTYKTLFTDNSIKPYICLDSETDKNYDEYSVAMPSPDYQSDNECCGDNINLFDGEGETGNIDASTGQNSTSNSAWRSKNYINVNDTSVSISAKDLTFSGTVGRLYFYKSDNSYISNNLINSLPFTATLPNETAKVRFFILNSIADINTKIKVENGMSTGYSEYGQGCINEVICNKNILPYVEKVNYNMVTGVDYYGITYMQKVKSNTAYVLSTIDKLISGFQLREYDKEGNVIQTTSKTLCKKFTTSSETYYIKFRTNDLVSKISNPNFMLEESKTLSDYTEHKKQVYTIPTQQPFRAIEAIRDTFIKKNNKWYERHYIPRKIFDGTESFAIKSQTEEYIIFEINQTGKARGFTNIICSHFKTLNSTTEECVRGSTGSSYVYINISKGRLSSIDSDGFKAWLTTQYNAGTPVYVDYLLETPIDIECTEEQSTILWNIEQNAKTYDKVTHMYSTDKISSYKEVTYKKDIETLFANTLVEGVG